MLALVTGATGFVGSAVVRQLLARGQAVRVLCRPGSDRRNLKGLDVDVFEGDLLDTDSLHRAVSGCTQLYHVAADYRLWSPDPEELYRVNVDGSRALLRAAREAGVERIVYTSSVAVLKVYEDGRVSDETSTATESDMIGHYKRSKYRAEQMVREEIASGSPIVMASPTAPIGPADIKPTPTGKIVVDAANGKIPAYLDTGLNVVHVDDVAMGHCLAMEKGRIGENYIFGAEDFSLYQILETVAGIMGTTPPKYKLSPSWIMPIAHISEALAKVLSKPPMVPLEGVRMAKKKMYFSHAKAQAELGYEPRPARQAIEDAVVWFKDQNYITK